MEQVTNLHEYTHESYRMFLVKPIGYINYGGNKNFVAFDYALLGKNWGLTYEQLEAIASTNPQFKFAKCFFYTETDTGATKTILLDGKVVPALLAKLRDSMYKPKEVNISKELCVINALLETVKGSNR